MTTLFKQEATGLPVKVLWQTWDTPVGDLSIQATPVLPAAELAAALGAADIVISHAGTGPALAALDAGRYPILPFETVPAVSRSMTTNTNWPPNSPAGAWPYTANRPPSPSTTCSRPRPWNLNPTHRVAATIRITPLVS